MWTLNKACASNCFAYAVQNIVLPRLGQLWKRVKLGPKRPLLNRQTPTSCSSVCSTNNDGGDCMSKKSKATKMKVMHVVEKDGNGQPTIRSVVSNPPKLREAVDKEQVA